MNTLRILVLGFGSLAAPLGCAQAPLAMRPAVDGLEVPILRSTSGVHSHISRPLRMVIRDERRFAEFPATGLKVDFRREMVVLAAMGPAPSPACAIAIERIYREGDALRAEVRQSYPPGDTRRRRGVASPYCAVVIPRTDLPIAGFSPVLPSDAFLARGGDGR